MYWKQAKSLFQFQPGSIKGRHAPEQDGAQAIAFQFQPGSIKGHVAAVRAEQPFVLFQFQPGSIKGEVYPSAAKPHAARFNSSLVLLKEEKRDSHHAEIGMVSIPAWFY